MAAVHNSLEPAMSRPLVVVDVQPAYTDAWNKMEQVMQAVNGHAGPVYMLVNAEADGLTPDTVDSCREFWCDRGMDEDTLGCVRSVDKGYGHLRGWMDNGADDEAIITILAEMLSRGELIWQPMPSRCCPDSPDVRK